MSTYHAYLKTPEWQVKRKAMLWIANHRCQLCNAGEGVLDVHHRHYDRVEQERPEDLLVLCRSCHGRFHDKVGKSDSKPDLAAQFKVDFRFRVVEERGYFEDVEGIRTAFDVLIPAIRDLRDPALRTGYIDRLAALTGVRRSTLEEEVGRPAPTPSADQRDGPEHLLLLLMVRDPERIGAASDLVPAEEIRGAVNRELFEALVRGGDGSEELSAMSAAAGGLLNELRAERAELSDPDRMFWEQVETIQMRPQLDRLDELQAQIADADPSEHAALFAEKAELKRKLKEKATELGRKGAKVSSRYRRYLVRTGR